jgi:hypothetical protein
MAQPTAPTTRQAPPQPSTQSAPVPATPVVVALPPTRPRPPQGPDVRLYTDGDFSRPPHTLKTR